MEDSMEQLDTLKDLAFLVRRLEQLEKENRELQRANAYLTQMVENTLGS